MRTKIGTPYLAPQLGTGEIRGAAVSPHRETLPRVDEGAVSAEQAEEINRAPDDSFNPERHPVLSKEQRVYLQAIRYFLQGQFPRSAVAHPTGR